MIDTAAPRSVHPNEHVRPIASALLTAGTLALRRRGSRRLGLALVVASLVLVSRQRARAERSGI